MPDEYQAVLRKVAEFAAGVETRGRAELRCRRGCDSCCHVWLTVSGVEALAIERAVASLPEPERAALRERGRHELAREQTPDGAPPRCAMLTPSGGCAIYEARPVVCRTQGHALLYAKGALGDDVARLRGPQGDVTHCPLNFTTRSPEPSDVLHAERLNELLAIVNHRDAQARGESHLARFALSSLAAETVVQGAAAAPRAATDPREGEP